jgi:hypothetical protein
VLTHVGHRELLTRTGTSDNNHSVKRVAPISKRASTHGPARASAPK